MGLALPQRLSSQFGLHPFCLEAAQPKDQFGGLRKGKAHPHNRRQSRSREVETQGKEVAEASGVRKTLV